MTEQTKKPILTLRDRGLSLSVFKHQGIGRDGSQQEFYGVCLQRSYKKKDAEDYTREQINLFPDDLLRMAALLQDGYRDLTKYVQDNRPAKNEYPSQAMTSDAPPVDWNNGDEIPF